MAWGRRPRQRPAEHPPPAAVDSWLLEVCLRIVGRSQKLKAQRKIANQADPVDTYLNASSESAEAMRREVARCTVLLVDKLCDKVIRLPVDYVDGFLCLIGHLAMPGRIDDDWPNVAKSLCAVTEGQENAMAMIKRYSISRSESALSDDIEPRIACLSFLEQYGEMVLSSPEAQLQRRALIQACTNRGVSFVQTHEAIRNHIIASNSIAAGGLIHQSGSLYLFDARVDRSQPSGKNALWLVRKRSDGIFAIGKLASEGTLKPSEIRDMRSFVRNYSGPDVIGEINQLDPLKSARLCKAIGLSRLSREFACLKDQSHLVH